MAFVLISWVSISVVFCLALVRAAARQCLSAEESTQVEATVMEMDDHAESLAPLPEARTASAAVMS